MSSLGAQVGHRAISVRPCGDVTSTGCCPSKGTAPLSSARPPQTRAAQSREGEEEGGTLPNHPQSCRPRSPAAAPAANIAPFQPARSEPDRGHRGWGSAFPKQSGAGTQAQSSGGCFWGWGLLWGSAEVTWAYRREGKCCVTHDARFIALSSYHILFETALEGERVGRGGPVLFFSFEDLNSVWGSGECVTHNCHGVPLTATPSAWQVFGAEELVSGAQCPAGEAAGWEAPCSATTVMPKMAVKRGKREGNALNPLRGRNVAGKSLETNLSESLKCNTLASGKFCQFLERAGWSQLLGRAHPCTGRGLPSPGGCTLGITVAASFALILEISRGG